MSGTILKLPENTIKKIAAGEVITRPVNVVKELVENSIDAQSTNIRVTIEQGGVRLIDVIDNGHGISRSNAKLLCQRYTTSKLHVADDLRRISTFGFRGEALASISEMADVDVNSFNEDTDKVGWQAKYKGGLLTHAPIDRYMQSPGTQITVRDLFLTVLPRKNAMKASFLDEKKAIQDLLMRFAIHHRSEITFTLSERNGTSENDLICSIAPNYIKPTVGSFFGFEMENNLIDFDIENDDGFDATIYIAFSHKRSSTNVHQSNMILFVNDRLVECDELRREIAAIVLEFLNVKQFVSLFYIAIDVPPQDVDINTHPAKATVTLHYQQEIIALVLTEVRRKFHAKLSSQIVEPKFTTQKSIGELLKYSSSQQDSPRVNLSPEQEKRLQILAPNCLSQERPETLSSTPVAQSSLQLNLYSEGDNRLQPLSSNSLSQDRPITIASTPVKRPYELVHNDSKQPNLSQSLTHVKLPPSRVRRDLKLRSIADLRLQVASEKSKENIKIIKDSVFVGIFDHSRALIQNDTKLYAINLKAYLKEQCYQFYLFDFGNFPPIEILPPGNKISFMISTYLEDLRKHNPVIYESLSFKSTESVIDELLSHSDMFADYLNLKFTRNEIFSLPCIIPDHVPNFVFLGKFLVDLVNKVDHTDEKNCFHQIGRVLSDFYSEPPANLKSIDVHRKYHMIVETRLYEAIKRYLLAPEWLFTKENICQVTDTKDLYKVFERC